MFHRAFNIGGLERENVPKGVGSAANRRAAVLSLSREKCEENTEEPCGNAGRGVLLEQWYKVDPIEYIIRYSVLQRAAMMSIAHDSAR